MNGWIKLHRRCLDHPCLKAFDAQGVWDKLLMLAAHEPYQDRLFGQTVTLKPGQLAIPVSSWAEKHGITRKRIRIILASFAEHGMIEMAQAKGHAFTLITICNYVFYQDRDSDRGQAQGQGRAKVGPTEQEDNKIPSPNGDGRQGPPAVEREQAAQAVPPAPQPTRSAKAALWAEMVRSIGGGEKAARSLIGRWLKEWDDGFVVTAHFQAVGKEPADYVSYMWATLRAKPRKHGKGWNGSAPPRPPQRPTQSPYRKRAVEQAIREGFDPDLREGLNRIAEIERELENEQCRAHAA